VLQRPGAGALVTGLVSVALIGGWLMWQPLRSAQAMADAENHPETAFASARAAASRDPLSLGPLNLLSALYEQASEPPSARAQLLKATQIQPSNPQSWLSLGQLDYANAQYAAAITELQHALALDLPVSQDTIDARTMVSQSQAQLIAQRAAAAKFTRQAQRRARAATRAAHRGARPRKRR
jgi:tetratricopeptide (TPR) repeat protein